MIIQMPIVDGLGATKMIREYESEGSPLKRIPVFAVSASLLEKDRQVYIDGGFDGWVMKPIDFQRVHELLRGVRAAEARSQCLYQAGMWEQGGWFDSG
jgi:CheY-like chemotaxis protein